MKELIFATGNAHKVREVLKVIDTAQYAVKSLKDIGYTEDIEETGSTLTENALIKAKHIADQLTANVFAEDSGLEVDTLDGEPGIFTARYAGPQKDATDNMNLLLENLKNAANRKAQFRAVIALIIDGKKVVFEGIVRGTIAQQIMGSDGFGYDPIFIPDGYDKTFAELPEAVKLSISHRTRALEKMVAFLKDY